MNTKREENTGPVQVYVVSHTHWDREWYLTQSEFQMLNVDMMEHMLAVLKENKAFTSFMLDGQLIALEDYLAVRPDQRGEITDLVRRGRIVIGPWYVLPDEFLASGEAHIRNYCIGMRVAGEFGGGMKIGYLPDSFGHPSQMPQIIRGLGMGEMIFWRGTGPEAEHAEFSWKGKDGSEILALHMAHGYSNAACLPGDARLRRERLNYEIQKLRKLSCLGLVLLMNGTDHVAPDGRVAGWIAEYQREHPDIQIRQTSLADYVREARRRAAQAKLQTVTGELRSGYRAYLLGDTLSARMPIKQRHREMEVLLENRLEPLFSFLSFEGKTEYPLAKLRHLWKCLLQNLPNDSICGCIVDAVHREMEGRYRRIEEAGKFLLIKASGFTQMETGPQNDTFDGGIRVYNGQLGKKRGVVRLKLQKLIRPLRYVDYQQDQKLLEITGDDGAPRPTGIMFTDARGREYPGWIADAETVDTVETSLFTQPVMNRCLSVTAGFTAEAPSLGYADYGYRFLYDTKDEPRQALENEFYRVTAEMDGTVSVYCKQTGRQYKGLNRFSDRGDTGDEYTADFLDGPEIGMNISGVKRTYRQNTLVVEGTLELPEALADDRTKRALQTVACNITTEVSLLPGNERVEFRTVFDNRAKDHCLAVLFPFGGMAEGCLSDSIFSIETRSLVESGGQNGYEGWVEPPNNSFFLKNFAQLHRARESLSVLAKGLPQFEVKRGETQDVLALTLLRCVGWLSRADLKSRKGNGGWTIQTPGAQEQGLHTFEYALSLRGDTPAWKLYDAAVAYTQGLFAVQTCRNCSAVPLREKTLFTSDQPSVFASAWKGAEDGDGWILRLIHMADAAAEARLSYQGSDDIGMSAVRLDETPLEDAELHWNPRTRTAMLKFRPWEIKTIRIRK